jgi:hypothetical protein
MGLPLIPPAWAESNESPAVESMKVPHRSTVVPGPIWPVPLPQFDGLLNHWGVCRFVKQLPWLLPLGVMFILMAEQRPGVEHVHTTMELRRKVRSLFTISSVLGLDGSGCVERPSRLGRPLQQELLQPLGASIPTKLHDSSVR